MYRRLKAPTSVQIELTERCPNACLHCYNAWRDRTHTSCAGRDFAQADVAKTVAELRAAGVFHVVLTGGEPFLNKSVLYGFLRGFRDVGIGCGVNSTLMGMTVGDISQLAELGTTGVLTSVLGPNSDVHDSITQHPGSFKHTIRGIRALVEHGRPPAVNMVITSKNMGVVRETAAFVASLGVRGFNATRAGCPSNCRDFSGLRIDEDAFRNNLRELAEIGAAGNLQVGFLESYPLCGIGDITDLEDLVGRKCLAGVTSMTVAVNGDIRPCSHLDINYGNLFTDGLAAVWERMSEWADGSYVPSSCKACTLLMFCGGGCRMEAKTQCGDIHAMDPFSNPKTVSSLTEQIRAYAHRESGVAAPVRFKVNPLCRFRTESFGGIAYTGPRFQMLLPAELIQWLQGLQQDQAVVETESVAAGQPEKLRLLTQMARQRIIQSV